ncbi:unnamed protein product [Notodromas monacha]|uniref:Microsomal glutathione S-transferase 1 n=1 Tax=Notodromas monacha TaxID=399045 RepID=A0A7R9C1C4_9CRUS|nr:unnamed protein product [Notodromas monacha]CAG0924351.1 unnamed protein product [Notodromas monacha]
MAFVEIDFHGEIFKHYALIIAFLVLKMMFYVPWTAVTRIRRGAFANPEDILPWIQDAKVTHNDEVVERIRRAHRNDLENIPFFMVIAWLYMMTGPSVDLAKTLFEVFAVCRYMHTMVYALFPLPAAARSLAFMLAFLVMGYMTICVLVSCYV